MRSQRRRPHLLLHPAQLRSPFRQLQAGPTDQSRTMLCYLLVLRLKKKVLVTRTGSSDTTINIASNSERGQDGTSAVSHDAGATVFPVFTSVDADEANELTSTWTTKGDIVAHGSSTFTRLAVGTNEHVLKADSSAATGLAYGQVATAGIAADAVDGTKIADDSINSEHYVDGSIDTAHLADDAVTAAKIATGAVGADALAATAVTAATYGDADSVGQFTVDADGRLTAAANVDIVVPTSGIADDAVTQAKIGAGAVGTTELGADAVDGTKIADDSINSEHYVDGSIDTAHLSADVIDGTKIADDAVASEHIADNAVALGTQTTGNYVETVAAGTGISVSGSDAEGATKTIATDATVFRGVRGNTTIYPQSDGTATITHGLGATVQAAFVNLREQTTGGSGGGETVIALPITAITNTTITVRVYEIDSGSGNTSGNVSTIFTASTNDASTDVISLDVSYVVFL